MRNNILEKTAGEQLLTDACQLCSIVLVINLLLVVANNDDCIEVRSESILACYPVTAPATSPRTM
jgi:hypothetical protein